MINKTAKREELVNDAIKKSNITSEVKGGGYVLTVPVPGDRTQKVRVAFEVSEYEHAPMVVVETTCGKASTDAFHWALRENRHMCLGAIAVDMIGGSEFFVLTENLLENEVTAKKLFRAVTYVARTGDKFEFKLTGQDVF